MKKEKAKEIMCNLLWWLMGLALGMGCLWLMVWVLSFGPCVAREAICR